MEVTNGIFQWHHLTIVTFKGSDGCQKRRHLFLWHLCQTFYDENILIIFVPTAHENNSSSNLKWKLNQLMIHDGEWLMNYSFDFPSKTYHTIYNINHYKLNLHNTPSLITENKQCWRLAILVSTTSIHSYKPVYHIDNLRQENRLKIERIPHHTITRSSLVLHFPDKSSSLKVFEI